MPKRRKRPRAARRRKPCAVGPGNLAMTAGLPLVRRVRPCASGNHDLGHSAGIPRFRPRADENLGRVAGRPPPASAGEVSGLSAARRQKVGLPPRPPAIRPRPRAARRWKPRAAGRPPPHLCPPSCWRKPRTGDQPPSGGNPWVETFGRPDIPEWRTRDECIPCPVYPSNNEAR